MNNNYYLAHGGPGSGRYPLGSGDRPYQKFEGSKRKRGIIGYIQTKRAKKNEEERQKQKLEYDLKKENEKNERQRVLREGSATEILRYKGEFSNKELENAKNRLELEKKLKELSQNEVKSAMDKVDDIMSRIKMGNNWLKIGTDVYNTIGAIYNATPDGRKKPLTLVNNPSGGGGGKGKK